MRKRMQSLLWVRCMEPLAFACLASVARCEEQPDSDVDFLVEFPRGYDLFSQRLPLTDRLAKLLGRKVDLIPEHELNRHIRDHVLAEAVDPMSNPRP